MPEKYKNKFPKGSTEFHETIAYTDYALQQFFETAKKQQWYNNTIFIITADHTSSAKKFGEYNTPIGMFKIPLLIFDPSSTHLVGNNSKNMQQIDILPSVLDLLQLDAEIITYGKSFKSSDDFVVNYSNNTYNYVSGDYYLAFNGKESVKLFNIKKDPLMLNNLVNKETIVQNKMEKFIKAYIQSFNYRMANNKLTIE